LKRRVSCNWFGEKSKMLRASNCLSLLGLFFFITKVCACFSNTYKKNWCVIDWIVHYVNWLYLLPSLCSFRESVVSDEEFSDKRENEKLVVSRRVFIDAVVEVFICASGQCYSSVWIGNDSWACSVFGLMASNGALWSMRKSRKTLSLCLNETKNLVLPFLDWPDVKKKTPRRSHYFIVLLKQKIPKCVRWREPV